MSAFWIVLWSKYQIVLEKDSHKIRKFDLTGRDRWWWWWCPHLIIFFGYDVIQQNKCCSHAHHSREDQSGDSFRKMTAECTFWGNKTRNNNKFLSDTLLIWWETNISGLNDHWQCNYVLLMIMISWQIPISIICVLEKYNVNCFVLPMSFFFLLSNYF